MTRNHGTISTYRDGCRCEDCDTYARAYERERGRRRRVGAPTTNLVDATPSDSTCGSSCAGMPIGTSTPCSASHSLPALPAHQASEPGHRAPHSRDSHPPITAAQPTIPADGSAAHAGPLHAGLFHRLAGHPFRGEPQSHQPGHPRAKQLHQGLSRREDRELYDAYWDKPAPDTRESRDSHSGAEARLAASAGLGRRPDRPHRRRA